MIQKHKQSAKNLIVKICITNAQKIKTTRHTRQPMSILPQQAPRAATVTAFYTKQDDYDNTHDWAKLQK